MRYGQIGPQVPTVWGLEPIGKFLSTISEKKDFRTNRTNTEAVCCLEWRGAYHITQCKNEVRILSGGVIKNLMLDSYIFGDIQRYELNI